MRCRKTKLEFKIFKMVKTCSGKFLLDNITVATIAPAAPTPTTTITTTTTTKKVKARPETIAAQPYMHHQ
jgi:hypothetical protein